MSTFTVQSANSFSMETLQLFQLFEKTNESRLAVQYKTFFDANNFTSFNGAGLTYGGAFPNTTLTGGTITSITDRAAGLNVFALTAISIQATDLFGLYQIGDTQSALGAMLFGDDTITGNAGNDVLYGYSGNDRIAGGLGADTMFGGGGNDTYVVDNLGDIVDETFGVGTDTVESSVDFILGNVVENLVLTGAAIRGEGNFSTNIITGNAQNNSIFGNGGDDDLRGEGGNDAIFGGSGNDAISGGAGNDTLEGGDGVDTLTGGTGNDTMSGGNGNDLMFGQEGNDTLNGDAGVDTLISGDGNDILNGGADPDFLEGGIGDDVLDGGAANDAMDGGAGNDVYFIDDSGDFIDDSAGIDRVEASVSHLLDAGIENLRLLGSAQFGIGNLLANTIHGNNTNNTLVGAPGNDVLYGAGGGDTLSGEDANDTLYGEDGNDTLDGGGENDSLWGGLGNDVLIGGPGIDGLRGGAGDDFYAAGAGDIIIENVNEGIDTVQSQVTIALTSNIENLVLDSLAGAANGTGNALNNRITGNQLANVLNGSTGADVMTGGLGSDSYVVDNVGDVVFETFGVSDIELVTSSIDFQLGAFVENLTLTGTAIKATGNNLANSLTGNIFNNSIDGRQGADTMAGQGGNDTYFIDNLGDTITEGVGLGIDTVFSSVTYTLEANVDNLTITGVNTTGGFGNALNNTIIGNTNANSIQGEGGNDIIEGGLGQDTMFGGLGLDDFRYNHLAADQDSIFDFAAGSDDIVVSAAAFGGGLAPGAFIAANRLVIGPVGGTPVANQAFGQFLFDKDDGRLIWDQNGTGAGGQFHIATLTFGLGAIPAINNFDFVVIA